MDIPPSYADIGINAKDLFNQGFDYDCHKVEFKSNTTNGTKFTTNLKNNNDSGLIDGSVESEYSIPGGVTIHHRWSKDNVLATDVTIEDALIKGLKLTLDTVIKPPTKYKHSQLKVCYKQENIHTNCDIDLKKGPVINGAAVVGKNGWIAGYQTAFNTATSKLTKNNFAIGYIGSNYTFSTAINDGNIFTGSYSHKISPSFEAAVQLSLNSSSHAMTAGIAGKYVLDETALIRGKINNTGHICVSYQQDLLKGVTLNLSSLCDGLTGDGHKVGLGITLAA